MEGDKSQMSKVRKSRRLSVRLSLPSGPQRKAFRHRIHPRGLGYAGGSQACDAGAAVGCEPGPEPPPRGRASPSGDWARSPSERQGPPFEGSLPLSGLDKDPLLAYREAEPQRN